MPGISSSHLPAAHAPPKDAVVRTGVHGNDDGHTDDDDDSDADNDDHTPDRSDWSPPSDLSDIFQTLAGIQSPHAWSESGRLGPNIKSLLKFWAAPASGFGAPQRDTCLHPAYDKLTKECKAFVDHAFACVAASSAAAHAVSHASAYMLRFVKNLPGLFEDDDHPGWSSFCTKAETAVTAHAISPLQDASKFLAHMVGRGVSTIRAGTIRNAAAAVQPVLRSSPLTADFFFGDPAVQVSSSVNLAVMSSLLGKKSSDSARGRGKRNFANRGASTSGASAPSSSYAPRTDRGRGWGKGRGRGAHK